MLKARQDSLPEHHFAPLWVQTDHGLHNHVHTAGELLSSRW